MYHCWKCGKSISHASRHTHCPHCHVPIKVKGRLMSRDNYLNVGKGRSLMDRIRKAKRGKKAD